MRNITVILGDPRKQDFVKPNSEFGKEDFKTIDELKKALSKLDYNFKYLDDHDTLYSELRRLRDNKEIDIAFNLCDEGFNNDPKKENVIPLMLETLEIPYTGADEKCMVLCYNKFQVYEHTKHMGIPIPKSILINPRKEDRHIDIEFPAIIKPNLGDGSSGITQDSVIRTHADFEKKIKDYDEPILIQEFLSGNDVSCGIISDKVLPLIEEDYSLIPNNLEQICGYEAKWDSDSPYSNLKSKKADINKDAEKLIKEYSLLLFENLKCRDYARFDWRLDSENIPRLLEVNPNPGWCYDGHLAKMYGFEETKDSYSKMLHAILKAAEKRLFQ
ncbi:MAG: ATP-grasp domain-containing protein [Nanoarchaeota archaeon]|nr:ATP-grasp domain-containing protein [Nanoarchaeota archaeon]